MSLGSVRSDFFYGAFLAILASAAGCALLRKEGEPVSVSKGSVVEESKVQRVDTMQFDGGVYRLEEELPEKSPRREAQFVEAVLPVERDTFVVQEVIAEQDTQRRRYSIGYRIKIFASSDRGAAERVRNRAEKETRMASYLDFEDGLYKVRLGDFAERKDAMAAKASMEKSFPGCWVVRTTIKIQ